MRDMRMRDAHEGCSCMGLTDQGAKKLQLGMDLGVEPATGVPPCQHLMSRRIAQPAGMGHTCGGGGGDEKGRAAEIDSSGSSSRRWSKAAAAAAADRRHLHPIRLLGKRWNRCPAVLAARHESDRPIQSAPAQSHV